MSIDPDSALDNLAAFIDAIATDAKLRVRFCEIAKMSPAQRSIQIHTIAHQMAAAGEDADLISSFRLLADPRVFEAAIAALRDCGLF